MTSSLDLRVRRGGSLGKLVAISLTFSALGCLVTERCYQDRDCPRREVCSAQGRCTFECAVDRDCEGAFGLEHNCISGHCELAATCTTCSFPNAEHSCVHGACQLTSCLAGYYDRDGVQANGCEYHCQDGRLDANGNPEDGCECTPTQDGIDHCNGVDDDCDGRIDEDFDLSSDVLHCGACNRACAVLPGSTPVCHNGSCLYDCKQGYFDNDGDPENGCENSSCRLSVERCNGRDDDCDCPGDTNGDSVVCGPGDEGVDEGFEKSSVKTCGPYCIACNFPNGSAACVEGSCRLLGCDEGYWNLNRRDIDGCEYACVATGTESCNSKDDDCDGLVDEGEVCVVSCPSDMVPVGAYCIDRYEASRADATAMSQGVDSSRAYSRAGVLPWMVNPMTKAELGAFESACAAAGKRLCTKDEWFAACTGPKLTTFVYGDHFDREACNCVDTYCDDYCEEMGQSTCSSAENCGYTYYSFHEVVTGSFVNCSNEYGTLDINGNVWEAVPSSSDSRGYELRGGAFNCASPSTRVNCGFNAGWTELYAGFRCCKAQE